MKQINTTSKPSKSELIKFIKDNDLANEALICDVLTLDSELYEALRKYNDAIEFLLRCKNAQGVENEITT